MRDITPFGRAKKMVNDLDDERINPWKGAIIKVLSHYQNDYDVYVEDIASELIMWLCHIHDTYTPQNRDGAISRGISSQAYRIFLKQSSTVYVPYYSPGSLMGNDSKKRPHDLRHRKSISEPAKGTPEWGHWKVLMDEIPENVIGLSEDFLAEKLDTNHAWEGLSEFQRTILILKAAGYTNQQLADIVGITRAGMNQHIIAARKKLKRR